MLCVFNLCRVLVLPFPIFSYCCIYQFSLEWVKGWKFWGKISLTGCKWSSFNANIPNVSVLQLSQGCSNPSSLGHVVKWYHNFFIRSHICMSYLNLINGCHKWKAPRFSSSPTAAVPKKPLSAAVSAAPLQHAATAADWDCGSGAGASFSQKSTSHPYSWQTSDQLEFN